jgi:hypothetical protein
MTAIGRNTGLDTSWLSLDRVIDVAVAAGVVCLVIIGFVTSYETLRSLAATDGGFPTWLAPAVPLSFDLGVVVLSLKVVAAARQGRHALLLRTLVAALSVSTVAVNSTAATGTAGRLLHAVPPAMFVICFESLVSGARRTRHPTRPRSTSIMFWLLAPATTLRSWRQRLLAANDAQPRKRQQSRQSNPATPASAPPAPADTAGNSRLECVREAIGQTPGMSASQLRDHLSRRGHDVSVRTAQRLKARVSLL